MSEHHVALEQHATLINHALIKAWLYWSLLWLSFFPLVGLLVAIKFHVPDFLGESAWLTFGRLRPVHVNGVIFGAFSTPLLGLLYYIVPRLCGRPMAAERLGWWALAGWNLFLITGSASLLAGYNLGFEADEFEWPLNILRFVTLGLVAGQVLSTIFRRREPGFYVSLWYTLAALVWTIFNLVLGNVVLPYVEMSGISNAALHGLFIHYVVGLWVTPAGLAVIYYFMPLAVKGPLFSHRLSLLGFWTIALFYPFVGLHHYLFSPIPYEHQTIAIVTSMMLIIPVWAVVTNIFMTAKGRWGEIMGGHTADHYAAKFLLLCNFYYLVGCFQGSTESLRRVQELTHFSDFVIGHSHNTVFGTFVIGMVGGMYYVWPRVTGRALWSQRLASWQLWLFIGGASLMFVSLAAQGFVQGSMLEYGANFVDTVVEMRPWWITRTLAGGVMDIGFLLMAINFYYTAREGRPFEEPAPAVSRELEAHPAGALAGGFNRPGTVFVVAGLGLFASAVILQGIMPSRQVEAHNDAVKDIASGAMVHASDYTAQELRGRQVYIREGCWYCHSQYIRPVTGETLRWGPLAQAGEYAFDQPQLLGTRRIGPDLSRVGLKYSQGWHGAHLWNPRDVVPDSVMPRFPWLYDTDSHGIPTLNDDGMALVAYLQKLGTNLGDWRETFIPTRLGAGASAPVVTGDKSALLALGMKVYLRRCVGCHGERGDGKGKAAQQFRVKPRDFTRGIYKFHSTPGADALPTDQDLFVTISHRMWGTPMPPWYTLPTEQRMAVIQYIKGFSERWQKERVGEPIPILEETAVSTDSLHHGQTLYDANCKLCHGAEGLGDGVVAANLSDSWGNSAFPANYTLPAGMAGGVKLGHDGPHLYRTVMNGVGGTPMPSFSGQLTSDEVWDVVHFIQSLRIDAQLKALKREGLLEGEEAAVRERLWINLSPAADRGQLETAVTMNGMSVAEGEKP